MNSEQKNLEPAYRFFTDDADENLNFLIFTSNLNGCQITDKCTDEWALADIQSLRPDCLVFDYATFDANQEYILENITSISELRIIPIAVIATIDSNLEILMKAGVDDIIIRPNDDLIWLFNKSLLIPKLKLLGELGQLRKAKEALSKENNKLKEALGLITSNTHVNGNFLEPMDDDYGDPEIDGICITKF